jgi:hypothetical protein
MPSPLGISELEEFWDAIRIDRIQITPVEEADGCIESIIEKSLETVALKFPAVLADKYSSESIHKWLTPVLIEFSRVLLHELLVEQRKKDATVLLQLFLEVPTMPALEVKDFLRNLPRETLNRILIRMEKQDRKTGLQALLVLECLFRDQDLTQDYEVERDNDGSLVVTLYVKSQNDSLSFRLRELFSA